MKHLKDFMGTNDLYYQESGGVLAPALSICEAKEEMHLVDEQSCDKDDVSQYQQLQTHGSSRFKVAKCASEQ